MITTLLFIGKLVAASGLLYGYYALFLRNRGFHQYNRFYLLIATMLALALPFISIPLQLGIAQQASTGLVKTLKVIAGGHWAEQEAGTGSPSPSHWPGLFESGVLLYAAGLAITLFVLLRSLRYIARIRRKYPSERIGNTRFYDTVEPGTPFSFFRFIFWNRAIPFDTRQGQQIFRHELYHVEQHHSSDILFMELVCCLAWFNPFFYLIRKELKVLHEFLADEYAAAAHNRLDYAELLVLHALQQKKAGIVHPFSRHQIKRRIMMITASAPLRRGYISRIMVLPLLLVLMSAFAVRLRGHNPVNLAARRGDKPAVVIIDAGHGGKDPGAHGINGVLEKDITLALAQKINELAGQYNIRVIMTRNSDELPGNANDIKIGLRKRVEITTEEKADLFVSLHVNTNGPGTNDIGFPGIEAYVAGRRTDAKAETLATTLLQQLSPIYNTSLVIQKRTERGIWVLEKSPCPAVLLECGNISLAEDEKFMTDKNNQEKLARGILGGIVKYLDSNR